MTNYVMGFMFSPDKASVLLIHKKRPVWQAGKWNGIGGHVEKGESAETAMCREFREETGANTQRDEWYRAFTLRCPRKYVLHVYRSFDLMNYIRSVQPVTDETPCVCPTTLHGVDVVPNLQWMVPLVMDEGLQPGFVINDLTMPGDGQ